jgi:hypothetical protein
MGENGVLIIIVSIIILHLKKKGQRRKARPFYPAIYHF